MRSSLDPPAKRRARKKVKGSTPKKLKDQIRKIQEEEPFARECLDYLLRYEGDNSELVSIRGYAMSHPNWTPDRETIVFVNRLAVEDKVQLRKRLMHANLDDLPDSLDDPGDI